MPLPASCGALLRAAVPATLLLLVLLVVPSAPAASYQVHACDGTNMNHSWAAYGDTGLVAADASCVADPGRGMKVRNSLRGAGQVPVVAPYGATGGLQAVAPAGTVITGLHGEATAYDERGSSSVDGWRAGIGGDGALNIWCAFQQACSWAGPPTLAVNLTFARSSVQLGVTCAIGSGCQRDRVRAATTLRNITLDVRDDVAPRVTAVRGSLWSGRSWQRGDSALGVYSSDNAGVRSISIEAGGLAVGSRSLPCDDYAMHPCPSEAELDASIDTARLPDGVNTVVIRAVDAGWNVSEDRATILVDNVAPTVATPVVEGGSAWRPANRFDVAIEARDGARGSGVRSVAWELCRVDGTSCSSGAVSGSPSALPVTVPARGEWKVRAWAVDDTSNTGAKSAWSEPLRFDDAVPGAARADAGDAWTHGDADSNVVVSLAGGAASGPSGISGYAVTRGGGEPGIVTTERGERVLVSLGKLPEGVTRIRARAISGAGVASAQVGEGLVRIDRTPPVVELSTDGAPLVAPEGEWLRQGVRLTAHATDQEHLSGMTFAAAGEPIERGAYLEYQVDEAPAVRIAASSKTIALPDDGTHVVTVHAVDAAGNVSDPQRASFRVDRNDPAGTIATIDHLTPRRLRAAVTEECLDSATLELRAENARDWTSYPAHTEKRAVAALIPDERLPAGAYAVRFRVRDCAGNVGLILYGAGEPASVRLPLRDLVAVSGGITAGTAKGAAHVTVHSGVRVLVRGRVTTLDGRFVNGRRVEFQQRIGTGDWRLRAVRVSDDVGRVAATLPAGPSRRIRLVVADNEQTIGATSRALAVAVPARVTLATSRTGLRNGQSVRFSGRLLGGYIPRTGRELELQGYNPLRGRWQPVRTQGLRTSRTGRWHTAYRFTATVGATVTYRFRVRVAPRPDHPFAEGFSRVVTVTVRG